MPVALSALVTTVASAAGMTNLAWIAAAVAGMLISLVTPEKMKIATKAIRPIRNRMLMTLPFQLIHGGADRPLNRRDYNASCEVLPRDGLRNQGLGICASSATCAGVSGAARNLSFTASAT